MNISEITEKALIILVINKPLTSREFAERMAPPQKMKEVSRPGETPGHKQVYAYGNYLAKLYTNGLVKKSRYRPGCLIHWTISDKGIEVLAERMKFLEEECTKRYIEDVKEINEHRAARGIEPLPTFKV